jgi:hypothetical protein
MAVNLHEMGAEFPVDLVMGALTKEVHIQLTQERSKRVRISELNRFARPIGHFKQVVEGVSFAVRGRLENTFFSDALRHKFGLRVGSGYDRQCLRIGSKGSDHLGAVDRVRAKDTEWVGVLRPE